MGVSSYAYLHGNVTTDLTANNTGEMVKASSAVLFAVEIDNTGNNTAVYVKIYDSATVTTASDDPDFCLKVPPGATFEFQPNMGLGITLAAGICVRCVDAGGTAGVNSPGQSVPVTVHWT